jgi:hypothetical protein
MDINVTLTVNAPDLVGAINNLAVSMAGTAAIEQPKARNSRKNHANEKPADASEETAAIKEPETAKGEPAKTEPEAPAAADTPKFTLEQVRNKLADLARSGKKAGVQEIIHSLGAKKLTDIPEEKYAEVMEKAEAL